MTSQIQAIIFGYQTVVRPEEVEACKELEKWSPLSHEKIHKALFKSPLKATYDRGRITSENFYKAVMYRIQAAHNQLNFKHFDSVWGNIFTEQAGIEKILSSINRSIELFFMANTNDMHWQHMKELKVMESIFDSSRQLILSHQFKHQVSESALHTKAILQMEYKREQILYVDTLSQPLEMFRRLGGKTLLHDSTQGGNATLIKKLREMGLLSKPTP